MRKKILEIEKKLELLLVISLVRISFYVIDQDPIFEDGQQLDFECATLGLSKNTETPDEEPVTTLAANIIGQMPSRKWVLAPMDTTQADVSSWSKTCQSLSVASIHLRDDTPSYRNPGRSSNLTAAIATSQAVTTKKYYSRPSLKLFTHPGRQVLLVAKENLQVRTDKSGYQNTVGNFYHRNREKVCQKLGSLY